MIEATIILLNMRGGCATIGDQVHALFRVNNRCSLTKLADDRKEGWGSAARQVTEKERAPCQDIRRDGRSIQSISDVSRLKRGLASQEARYR